MVTIPEIVESIVKRSPFLEEALSQGIINVSSLARNLLPDIRQEAMKEVQEGAVVMAINRLSKRLQGRKQQHRKLFSSPPDLMVRSNLFEITMVNSESLARKRKALLDHVSSQPNYFLTMTQGIFETTIIASVDLKKQVFSAFQGERLISSIEDLSALTVQLPKGTAEVPGAYSFILKALAWEHINIVEVVSTLNEFTIILEDINIDKAFFVIKRLF